MCLRWLQIVRISHDGRIFWSDPDVQLLPSEMQRVHRKEQSFIFSCLHWPWHTSAFPLHTTQIVNVWASESLSGDLEAWGLLVWENERQQKEKKKNPEQIRNVSTSRNKSFWISPFFGLLLLTSAWCQIGDNNCNCFKVDQEDLDVKQHELWKGIPV